MKNKHLLKIADISGWLLLVILILYFISGYAIVHKYGMEYLMNNEHAWFWHQYLTIPFFIFLFLHIIPYYYVRKQIKKLAVILIIVFALPVLGVLAINMYQKPTTKQLIKKEQQKSITCPNCPRGCKLKHGQTGDCGKFKNQNGMIIPVK